MAHRRDGNNVFDEGSHKFFICQLIFRKKVAFLCVKHRQLVGAVILTAKARSKMP
jgi:hypothetical protein